MNMSRNLIRLLLLTGIFLTACTTTAVEQVTPDSPVLTITPASTTRPPSTASADVTSTPAEVQPTATPAAPALWRITEPGCCVQPFWSADGREVLFIDRPEDDGPAGIYGVRIENDTFFQYSRQVGLPSPDGRYLAFLNDLGETAIVDTVLSREWVIPNGGQRIFFSPGNVNLAWGQAVRTTNSGTAATIVHVSELSGDNPRVVTTAYAGGIAGWLDDEHLLLYGRDAPQSANLALFSYDISNGARVDLVQNQRIYAVLIAPGGQWIQYTVALQHEALDINGMWVVSANGQVTHKLDMAGGARWRDETRLLLIPLEQDALHTIWQFDAETGKTELLIDPHQVSLRISANNWAISPDGEHLVFLNAKDEALWLLELPAIPVNAPD